MKEIEGKYSPNDWDRARVAGYSNPRDRQAAITEDIRQKGQINPGHYGEWDKGRNGLYEGYHRYAALRKLGRKTMKITKD